MFINHLCLSWESPHLWSLRTLLGTIGLIILGSIPIGNLESQTITPRDLVNPKSTGSSIHSILDEANLLGIEEEERLQAILNALEREKGSQIAVVLLNSIGDNDAKTFAHELFNHWGIGRKGIDDGLLFLLVQDQRQWVFETGYGLEGTLPDVTLKRLGVNLLVPKLREGLPGVGLIEMFITIADIIRADGSLDGVNLGQISDWNTGNESSESEPGFWDDDTILTVCVVGGFAYLFVCLFFIGDAMETFAKITRQEKSVGARLEELKKFWKKPWIKVGFLFLLPMMIGIGIVFFSHYRRISRTRKACPSCGSNSFEALTNQKSQKYMEPMEAMEHKLGGRTTEVWRCGSCKHMQKISITGPYASNYLCPACNHYTIKSKYGHTIVYPTYSFGGTDQYIDECLNCGYTNKREVTTPKLVPEVTETSSSVSKSYSSSSGSSSYSSSSSSSSSWGGGRSGGGGASGSW